MRRYFIIENGRNLFSGDIAKVSNKNLSAHCPVKVVISSTESIKLSKNISTTNKAKGLSNKTKSIGFCQGILRFTRFKYFSTNLDQHTNAQLHLGSR